MCDSAQTRLRWAGAICAGGLESQGAAPAAGAPGVPCRTCDILHEGGVAPVLDAPAVHVFKHLGHEVLLVGLDDGDRAHLVDPRERHHIGLQLGGHLLGGHRRGANLGCRGWHLLSSRSAQVAGPKHAAGEALASCGLAGGHQAAQPAPEQGGRAALHSCERDKGGGGEMNLGPMGGEEGSCGTSYTLAQTPFPLSNTDGRTLNGLINGLGALGLVNKHYTSGHGPAPSGLSP